MHLKRKIVAIVGPTASGKTAVAVKFAKKYNGEIVSADSRQVYRGLDIGTGKDMKEYGKVKYHLIDIKNPGEKFTLFDYLPLARAAIEDIFSRGKLPIIVGGTGLYVQGLIEGFELEQNYESRIMNHGIYSRQQLNNKTIEQLQKILREIDPEVLEKVDKQNPHRLIRAIEKAQSGETVTKVKPNFEVLQIGLDLPREELYLRIDRRVDKRFEQGMLDEIIGLLSMGVSSNWLIGLGLEYKIITEFIISNLKLKIFPHTDGIPPQAVTNKIQISNNKKDFKIKNLKLTELTQNNIVRACRELLHPRITEESKNKCVSPELNKNLELNIKNSPEFEGMRQELKYKSHQYAKRQLTWFRRFPEIVWLKDYKKIVTQVRAFLS